jgi:hypothetical protein
MDSASILESQDKGTWEGARISMVSIVSKPDSVSTISDMARSDDMAAICYFSNHSVTRSGTFVMVVEFEIWGMRLYGWTLKMEKKMERGLVEIQCALLYSKQIT